MLPACGKAVVLKVDQSAEERQPAAEAVETVQSMVKAPPITERPAVAVTPPVADTVPVAIVATVLLLTAHTRFPGVHVVVVAPGLGVKSVAELIALAKQKPGQINFGSSGIGSGTHFAGEKFKLAAAIDVVHVPYKGTPEAINDTIAGRIQYFISPVLPAMSLVKGGRLLGLAVTTRERLALLPDVPTIAEAALPGFEYDGWYGIFVPAKTPRAIVNQLATEVGRILRLPDVIERIASQGAKPKPTTPEEFDQLVREEIVMRGKVFKASGARPD